MSFIYCQNPECGVYLGSLGGDQCSICGWSSGSTESSYAAPPTQAQAQELPDERAADFELICKAIDKADTITMEGDYMLDSGDCIQVVRTMQALLDITRPRRAALAAKPVPEDVRLWTWEHYAQLRHTRVTDPYGNEYLMMDSDAVHSNTIRLFHAMFTALNNAAIAAQGGKV